MSVVTAPKGLDQAVLREAIRGEYREVAEHPDKGFHFHTGRTLAGITGYTEELLACVPEQALACFAGTGNPFAMGSLQPGERAVDLGCGAGMDSFIAARQVGTGGAVVGIDMTEEMLAKAEAARTAADLPQLRFRQGYLEELPVEDDWADVVISNGVVNLCPDKLRAFREMHRVLKPGGRLQIGDILVHKPVSDSARQKIDLWTG
jgi:SAM-dependent methyltransferase